MINISRYNIILASNSPRRRELLSGANIEFKIKVLEDIDEDFPDNIPKEQVAEYLSKIKASSYSNILTSNDLIITADTIVLMDNKIYGKPIDLADARQMLKELSGKTHQVITGVSLTTLDKQVSFSDITQVTFGELIDSDIEYYIDNYKPFDKAGAYGIQEWIGYIGVKSIEGSYFNVMGLPIYRVCNELKNF